MRVIWLAHAEAALRNTEEYILQKYGEISRERFMLEVEDIAYLLEKMPELGHFEPLLTNYEQGYRSIVINHLNKLIYYIKGNEIIIVALWDCRREPKKLIKDMKLPQTD